MEFCAGSVGAIFVSRTSEPRRIADGFPLRIAGAGREEKDAAPHDLRASPGERPGRTTPPVQSGVNRATIEVIDADLRINDETVHVRGNQSVGLHCDANRFIRDCITRNDRARDHSQRVTGPVVAAGHINAGRSGSGGILRSGPFPEIWLPAIMLSARVAPGAWACNATPGKPLFFRVLFTMTFPKVVKRWEVNRPTPAPAPGCWNPLFCDVFPVIVL